MALAAGLLEMQLRTRLFSQWSLADADTKTHRIRKILQPLLVGPVDHVLRPLHDFEIRRDREQRSVWL
jgi:hypothetical protein